MKIPILKLISALSYMVSLISFIWGIIELIISMQGYKTFNWWSCSITIIGAIIYSFSEIMVIFFTRKEEQEANTDYKYKSGWEKRLDELTKRQKQK